MNMSIEETYSEFEGRIASYLSGEMTPAESREFEEALRRDPKLKSRVDEFRKIWESANAAAPEQSYDLDREWALMKAQIPELATEKSIAREGKGKSRSLLYYTYRIAAALVVGLLFAFGWIYGTGLAGTEKVVAHAESLELILDDGTHITLNRDSKLRYKKSYPSSGRKVSLSGEAWFDVARDTAHPFVIDAGEATVEVLGTSFNVNAYKENQTVEITVESGMVALSTKAEKKAGQEQIILKAGNSGSYHKQKQELVLISRADPNSISWKTRELYFDATPLQEAVELISKVYGTQIRIASEELADCPITVTFSDQELEAVLQVLKLTLDLDITRQGETILLDGAACN
jgi:ferric-dicitrate binding protein FerR (iron transport regulator)